MSIPAESSARHDRALRGTPIAVYHRLLELLHPVEWREVKRFALCAELRIGRTTMRGAFALLIRRGYLERDDQSRAQPGQARRYRLCYSRKQSAA